MPQAGRHIPVPQASRRIPVAASRSPIFRKILLADNNFFPKFAVPLPDSIMVVRQILDLNVEVRALVGQQKSPSFGGAFSLSVEDLLYNHLVGYDHL